MQKCVDLKISSDKRFIVKEDGNPFFWLGDTAWELFHKLDREEALEYLTTRAGQKFTVVQAVVLSEFEGLNAANSYGRFPLLKNDKGEYDPTLPDLDKSKGDYTYWDHVDYIIDTACSLGIYVGLLPTWGDKFNIKWGKGPVIFNPENAYAYGKWIGDRYKDRANIIWIMGGDRPLETEEHQSTVRNMAKGIKEATGKRHLMTFHPSGFSSSSNYVHNEEWLDFNMIQSGHGGVNIKTYEFIQKDYGLTPIKPTLDGEPRYEDHPVNFNAENGYFDDYDIRVAAYWAILSGAFGHTYGHHCIWSYNRERTDYYVMDWKEAVVRPGACQLKFFRELMSSKPFLERTPCQELLETNYKGANYITAAKGEKYAFLYTPNGLDVNVKLGMLKGSKIKASWFDPRKGTYIYIGVNENKGTIKYIPPSRGRNNDWVLVLDAID